MIASLSKNEVEFEGYAALFNVTDMAGDIIRPGAFQASITKFKKLIPAQPSRIMMLYQHAAEHPVGRWTHIQEDAYGLFVRGLLCANTRQGNDLYKLVRAKALDGLSIGFKPRRTRRMRNGKRELVDVALWEVSIVTFPMAQEARISRVSDLGFALPKNLLRD